MNEPSIDFVVLAPLDEEILSLSQELNFPIDDPEVLSDGITCYRTTIKNNEEKDILVCIIQLKEMGNLSAAVIATKYILHWEPWCVVSFGIAGGFLGEDVELHDIIVPSEIYYYEPSKETVAHNVLGLLPNDSDQTSMSYTLSENMSKPFPVRESRVKPFITSRQLMVTCYRVKSSFEKMLNCRCRIGVPLASGEKKIADVDSPSRKAILNIHSKMIGIEMEAAGVGAAVSGCSEFNTHFLVVKGISDDASFIENNKSDHRLINRQTAANNAAKFLNKVIKASQPDHYEKMEPIDINNLHRIAKTFKNTFPEFLVNQLDEMRLIRVLNPINFPPSVFYHWRIRHEHIHWVDFVHLLVLRQLQEVVKDLPIYLLLSDIHPYFSNARAHTEKVIRAVLQHNVQLSWYSEIFKDRSRYIKYAQSQGFDEAALSTVRDTHHILGLKEGNLIDEEWIQYIAWTIRNSGRSIIIVWEKHAKIYEQIMNVVSQNHLIIRTRDLLLDKTLGKLEQPGIDLMVEPPKYDSIINWLESMPPTPYVRDLAMYLTLGKYESWENLVEKIFHDGVGLLVDRPQLTKMIDNTTNNPEFSKAACNILASLLKWNCDFFEE